MLHLQTILPDTLELLKKFSAQPEMEGLRLVGGTALALHYGHRQSIDLDFFGKLSVSQDEILAMVSKIGDYVVNNYNASILQMTVNGIKVDIVDYSRYEWIAPPVIEEGIVLASPPDIAAMKINAIEGRGSRKDFVDIYVLLQKYSIDEILGFYSQKYPNYSIFRALLSLAYFEDAEAQAMPCMFIPDKWEEMRSYITKIVKTSQ